MCKGVTPNSSIVTKLSFCYLIQKHSLFYEIIPTKVAWDCKSLENVHVLCMYAHMYIRMYLDLDFSWGPPTVSTMLLKLSTALWQANRCLPAYSTQTWTTFNTDYSPFTFRSRGHSLSSLRHTTSHWCVIKYIVLAVTCRFSRYALSFTSALYMHSTIEPIH